MKTSLDHLSSHKQAELRQLVSVLIPRYTEIEMIILFGSYARGTQVEQHIYTEKGTTYEYKSDYDLLIVLSKNAHANSDTLTRAMTERMEGLNFITPVQPIFHGVDNVNHELRDRNYFFNEIKDEGVLLFTTNRYELEEKREFSPEEYRAKAQADFDRWFKSADLFYKYFEIALQDSQTDKDSLNVAAFLLHQATERYYGAVHLVYTGYKPKTHDILILGRVAKAFDIEFARVFPHRSGPESIQFELLRRAYVDARYNPDYRISKEDLSYLSERVQMLRQLALESCTRRISEFV